MAYFLKPVDADLVISGNLLYANVTTRNVGINTASPTSSLQVVGNAVVGNIVATGASFATISTTTANITSATFGTTVSNSATIIGNVVAGNISATGASFSTISSTGLVTLGPITNVKISGGVANNVVLTDGLGNLSFGNVDLLVSGNVIPLGANTVGSLTSALPLAGNTVTDSIALLNRFLGSMTTITGTYTGVLYATNLYGNLATANQPLITTLANTVTIGNVLTSNLFFPNGKSFVTTVLSNDPNLVATNAAIVTANLSMLGYVNTLHASMLANVVGANAAIISNVATLNANIAGANAAIVTANAYGVSYANSLNSAMIANVTAANNAIVLNTNGIQSLTSSLVATNVAIIANSVSTNANIAFANANVVSYVNTLNSAMASNVAGANAAIVTANNAVVSYVNSLNASVTANIISADNAINAINANLGSFENYANVTYVSGKSSNVVLLVGNVPSTIDTFNAHAYTTMKYVVQATHLNDVQSNDMLVVTNGTSVLQTEYAALTTATIPLFTTSTTISSGIVSVNITPYYGNTAIDLTRIQTTSRV